MRVRIAAPPSDPRAGPGQKPLASPAVRRRAWDLGIELQFVPGTGPGGRITQRISTPMSPSRSRRLRPSPRRGRRGATASRRCRSSVCAARSPSICRNRSGRSRISPISRRSTSPRSRNCARELNETYPDREHLTLLPFLIRAMVNAAAAHPQVNARYDDEAGVLHRHAARACRHRDADRRRAAGAGGPPRRGARSVAERRRDCAGSRRRRAPARRRATS